MLFMYILIKIRQIISDNFFTMRGEQHESTF